MTASEIAGQLKSVGWQQRHYKSSKPKGIAPSVSLGPREAALSTRNAGSAVRPVWSWGRVGHKGGGRTGHPGLSPDVRVKAKAWKGSVPGRQHSRAEKQLRMRYKNATG